MYDSEFKDISAEDLKQFIRAEKEKNYVIVDVRQPAEYAGGHIPGAKFIPLNELMADFSGLPSDRDLIFYCHSGGRSMAAASMVSEEMVTEKNIYNLKGGILAWEGKKIRGFPKIQVFGKNKPAADLLLTAMELEKGAWRFYTHILETADADSIRLTLDKLSKAEIAHAKTVYGFWQTVADTAHPFEKLYAGLKGEILEGGEDLATMFEYLANIRENRCIRIIEMALYIEYAAFDLYRTMAENTPDQTARQAFFTIAQAEKNHMRSLTRALDFCE